MTVPSAGRLLLTMVLGLVVTSTGLAAGKDVRVERLEVDARLSANGTLDVEERVVFLLSGGPFTRIYRELPSQADGVSLVAAEGDGQPLVEGGEPGVAQSRTPEELRVEWRFPPAGDVKKTLVLRYRVVGIVARDEGGDRLRWSPLPSRHEYTIDSSRVVVRWPGLGIIPTRVSTRRDEDVRVDQDQQPDGVTFVSGRIRRNDDYQLRITFAPGGFQGPVPAWQVAERAQSDQARAHGLTGAALFVFVAFSLSFYWWQHRPETRWSRSEPPSLVLPSSVPVALAAAVKARTGRPPMSAAWGTLMALARQGFVSVEAGDSHAKLPAFRVKRLTAGEPANAHERQLLAHVFRAGQPSRAGQIAEVTKTRLEECRRAFRHAVWVDLKRAGYLDEGRLAARHVLFRVGAGLAIAGGLGVIVAGFVGANSSLGVTLAFVPLGLAAAGGVAAVLGSVLTPLSERGIAEGARCSRVARGLSDAVRGTHRPPALDWAAALPFATAFGLGAALAGRSTELGIEAPPWSCRRAAHNRGDTGDPWLAFLSSSSSTAGGGDSSMAGGSAAGADGGGGGSGAD